MRKNKVCKQGVQASVPRMDIQLQLRFREVPTRNDSNNALLFSRHAPMREHGRAGSEHRDKRRWSFSEAMTTFSRIWNQYLPKTTRRAHHGRALCRLLITSPQFPELTTTTTCGLVSDILSPQSSAPVPLGEPSNRMNG